MIVNALDLPLSFSSRIYWFKQPFNIYVKKLLNYAQKTIKEDINYKPIANIETINILLTVLQIALPSLTNAELIHEIQTMISNGKILNNFNPTRSEPFHNPLTHPFTPTPTNGPSQLRSLPSNSYSSQLSLSLFLLLTFCKTSSIVEDAFID